MKDTMTLMGVTQRIYSYLNKNKCSLPEMILPRISQKDVGPNQKVWTLYILFPEGEDWLVDIGAFETADELMAWLDNPRASQRVINRELKAALLRFQAECKRFPHFLPDAWQEEYEQTQADYEVYEDFMNEVDKDIPFECVQTFLDDKPRLVKPYSYSVVIAAYGDDRAYFEEWLRAGKPTPAQVHAMIPLDTGEDPIF